MESPSSWTHRLLSAPHDQYQTMPVTELTAVLRACERGLDCSLCFRVLRPDWLERLLPLLPSRLRAHHQAFCWQHKRTDLDACRRSCGLQAVSGCLANGQATLFECWAGAHEWIAPIRHQGHLVGLLHAGPFRLRQSQDPTLPHWIQARLHAARAQLIPLQLYLEHICRQTARASEQQDARSRHIIAFLDRHLQTDPCLGDLAKHLHLSVDWTGHLVRRLTGCSFQSLKRQRRLLVAQQALMDSDASIGAIARQAGYGDADYFCRAFKRATGQTPSQWRAAYQQDQSV